MSVYWVAWKDFGSGGAAGEASPISDGANTSWCQIRFTAGQG